MSRTDLDLTAGATMEEVHRILLAATREYDVPIVSERLVMFVEKLQDCDLEKDGLFPFIPVTESTAVEGRVRSIEAVNRLPKVVTLIVVKGDYQQQVTATITYDERSTPLGMKLKVQ